MPLAMAKVAGDRPPAEYEDWDYERGRRFEAQVLRRYNSSVHHPSSSVSGSFFLLAVFRHFSFRLTEESVGMALHSILGGAPGGFHIRHQQHSHFRFSVTSKEVGFLVKSLRCVTTKHFDVYFFLWSGGGARWQKDLRDWEEEEEDDWTLVSRKKKRSGKHVSFSSPIKQRSPALKASPQLDSFSVMIGDILCPIFLEKQRRPKYCLTTDASVVDVPRAFSTIKSSL